jgi:HSP20 family protein
MEGLTLRTIHETPVSLRRSTGSPFGIERRMDDLLDQFFGGFSVMPIGISEMSGTFSPRMDIQETTDAIKVKAELPGIDRNDIDVSVRDGVLTISGEKKVEKEEKGTDYHHLERSFGCFTRSISLPQTVETEKVEAQYRDGVLVVTVPKSAKAVEGSKKIPIAA